MKVRNKKNTSLLFYLKFTRRTAQKNGVSASCQSTCFLRREIHSQEEPRGPWLQSLISVVAAMVFLLCLCQVALGSMVTRGPYLQSGTPNSMIVKWRTDMPTDSNVLYGTAMTTLGVSAQSMDVTTEHEMLLPELLPDTKYFYSIGTTTQVLTGGDSNHFFVTPPLVGTAKPTRIWVIGDSGTGSSSAAAVRDAYFSFTGTRYTDFWLMLGDNAMPEGTDNQFQAAVFNMYPSLLRQSVLWPTLGNHDGANSLSQTGPYFDIFTLPTNGEAGGLSSGTEAYYSFDYGNIHFICLDSHGTDRSPTGAMLIWLAADLAANVQDWIIAFWHHPPYSNGSFDSDLPGKLAEMRENVLPILENYGADVVLAGHNHSYERSFLLDGHYGTSETLTSSMVKDSGDGRWDGDEVYQKTSLGPLTHEGTVYVVAGVSGSTGRKSNHPVMIKSLNTLGSLVLDISTDRLNATFLDSVGTVRDTFGILKGPDMTPPVITSVMAKGNLMTVFVDFSEPVERLSAMNTNNYQIDNGVTVNAASLGTEGRKVTLLTTLPLSTEISYTLTVANVSDLTGNTVVSTSQQFEHIPLPTDDFSDGNMEGWSVIDEGGNSSPSNWNVQNGNLRQSSNIYGPNSGATNNRKGTFAYWNDPAALLWTDYTFDVTIRSTDNDGIGVMFRYHDQWNYYKYEMDKQKNFHKLFKVVNGVETTLASKSAGYTKYADMYLQVEVSGDQISVKLDGANVFGGPIDDSDLTAGTVALYSWGNKVSIFDDVLVNSIF